MPSQIEEKELSEMTFEDWTDVLGVEPTCVIASRVVDGKTVIAHAHTDETVECRLSLTADRWEERT